MGEAPLPQRARSYWGTRISALHEKLEKLLEAERAQLPPWFAVGFGAGIAAWFALGAQEQWLGFLCIAAAIALLGFSCGVGRAPRAMGFFALAALLGCALVWGRAEWVAHTKLSRPVVTEVTGEVRTVDHLAARKIDRLLVVTKDTALPSLVRISVDQDKLPDSIAAGAEIRLRARLAPPPPMALPGTYDFARDAWFKGIGAVGKAIGAIAVEKPATPKGLDRVRSGLRHHVSSQLPPSSAGIAIALAAGDQNGVEEADAEAMRRSGLTHLLSVSGLHIAAVVAFAMLLSLKLLALSERLALRFNLVLVSAGVGAVAGIGYTLLTGAQVPTVRSCVAALLVLAGVALGREAISLRLVASGALIVLLFRPEALAGPSFQMSFAAVTAIVALHSSSWSRRHFQRRDEGFPARLIRGLVATIVTGLVVEFALIPMALFHFHRSGLYGVAANIVAIPLTTFVIMPLEAGALLLDAVDWGRPLWFMCGIAIDALLCIAHTVSAAKGAVAMLPSMPGWAFGLMVVGGLWLCLWQTRLRRLGIAPFFAGAMGAAFAPAPDLLLTGDGRHLAIVGDGGAPYILRERAGDYIRDLLAEASGFDGDPVELGSRPFSACSKDACVALIPKAQSEWRLLATRSSNRIDWSRLTQACTAADIAVSDRWLPKGCSPRWLKLDREALEKTGSLAIRLEGKPKVQTVAGRLANHPWAG